VFDRPGLIAWAGRFLAIYGTDAIAERRAAWHAAAGA
jgi:hypothetical protein